MANHPSFAVVLPVYNEEAIIESCISNIQHFLALNSINANIIAVNDGSKDSTAEVLSALKEKIPTLIVETHVQNGGYGAACRTGFAAAVRVGVDYALVMDADGTQDPEHIKRFFNPMQLGISFIKATRYAKGGKTVGVSWARKAPSYWGNKLARLMLRLPITDYTNGFRAIKATVLKDLQTSERGFSVLIEEVVCAKKLGASFAEVPYTLSVRVADGSQSKFIYSWNVYYNYLKHLF